MDQPPQTNSLAGVVEVNDLDKFVQALVGWHDAKTALLKHMQSIPEGAQVTFGDTPDPVDLSGDLLKGFQLGLHVALSEMGTLPFTFELEDEATPATPT